MEEVAIQQQQPASTVAVADTTAVAVPSVPNMKSTCHSQVLTADSAGALYGKEQTEAARIKLRHELQCGGQCAIHALNAICQERLFTKDHFLNCAKELHSEQNKLYCREDKKRTNDLVGKNGYVEIVVEPHFFTKLLTAVAVAAVAATATATATTTTACHLYCYCYYY